VEQSPKIWDIAAVWVIVKAAGAVWISLDDLQLFPLTPGQDYGRQAYRTLILSRKALLPEFLPRIR
jgi:myo-inositol-1(or 4)-monophosphatase